MKKTIVLLLLCIVVSGCALAKRMSERGVYVTATVASLPKWFNNIKTQSKACGINTIVIDAKQALTPQFLPLIKERKLRPDIKVSPSPWLSKITKELHAEGFIVTARVVVIKDDQLVLARPDLGIHLAGGALYRDKKGGKWVDPYKDEVRLYNALIAEAAALSGVDEVQFDYVRFPAEGNARSAVYPTAGKGVTKVDIICEFLKEVRERTKKYDTSLAVDIFGVTAWQSKFDIDTLGQDLKRMAKYLDVLCPMLYPSHFHAGYDGFANPGSHPYYFMNTGVKKSLEILSGEATVLAPWIQGFNLASPNYGPQYIRDQVKACKDEGVDRFLIWNARNVYDVSFNALRK
ncbi:MAG: putative glycoside hydrolase [Candidatus Margulisiibacteriota bacterium]